MDKLIFRGQEVRVHRDKGGNSVWMTSVGKPHHQVGRPASVGLNEDLLRAALRNNVTLAIRIDELQRRLITTAKQFKKEAWIKQFKGFKMYMLPYKRYFLK